MGKTTKSSKKQTKSTKKPAHTSRSSTTPTTASQQRATWAVHEEIDLLDTYCEARKDASLTTDKGLKTKAWRTQTGALNAKHNRSLDKEAHSYKAFKATTFKQLVKRGNIHSKVVVKQKSIV
ncbi:hypothetical protein F444_09330 [Phytophthora nicotianae P1976]|uniref:Myb/SANT-like domain-containing protein n=1 Tax=Phytophthora nicotianae P1976 TaxID=1317066 RepID=A0A081A827_PHYNI|nr:hypothetical protein F444_09330 [Phytophthora nicotianae P1976]